MKRIIAALSAATVLLAGCNQYDKTPSGVKYKITKGGSTQTLKQGQFIKFNVEYKMSGKDSVISSTFGRVPGYTRVDTTRIPKHSFQELLAQLAPGDKVEFVLSVDSLKKLGYLDYNQQFHARDMIKGRAEILKTFPTEADIKADVDKEMNLEKGREVKDVQAWASKKNLKTQSVPSGVLVVVDNPGEGPKPDTGWVVKLLYRGSLPDGKEFDSNMDPKNPNNQPLVVTIGAHGVIQGLEDGLMLFGKGGKGKVLIPALLGYGPAGNPPVIPPYANMVFDVEILDVAAAAPKAVPAPGKK